MKTFLTTVKGKIIAGVGTIGVIGAIVATVLALNSGYRTITVNELNGITCVVFENQQADAYVGQHLKSGHDVTVNTNADMTLLLDDDKYVFAEENTHFWITAKGKKDDTRTVIHLEDGSNLCRIDNKLASSESFNVETPNATMSVRGTVFRTTTSKDSNGYTYTLIEVFEGEVYTEAVMEGSRQVRDSRTIRAGESATIRSDPDFSEFVIDGEKTEINYRSIPKNTALFLGKTIDSGRKISIEKELLYDYVTIIDHDFSVHADEVQATCDHEGYYYPQCSICGEKDDAKVIVPIIEHESVFEDQEVDSCDQEKYRIEKCKNCGLELSRKLLLDEHTLDAGYVVTNPTCETDGLLVYTCTTCNKRVEVVLSAPGHIYADANADGSNLSDSQKKEHCLVCQNNSKEEAAKDNLTEEIALCEHEYVNITKEATCEEEGSLTRKCSKCEFTISSVLKKTGHKFGTATVTKKATCTADGEESKTCLLCNKTEKTVVKATGHKYGAEQTTREATCTSNGEKIKTCTVCNYVEKIVVNASGHQYGPETTEKAATCTEAGKKSKICSLCGDKVETTISAHGHHFGAYATINDSTCRAPGISRAVCNDCGLTDDKEIPMKVHNYTQLTSTSQQNIADGFFYHTYECPFCHSTMDYRCSPDPTNGKCSECGGYCIH